MDDVLTIEIINPMENTDEKLCKALEVLSKATGRELELEHVESEPTPYKALQQLADEAHRPVQEALVALFQRIVHEWLGMGLGKALSDPIRINGKIYINPKTGKPLTGKEWKQIQADLTRIFNWLYGQTPEAMIKQAIALGKVLQSMDPDSRLSSNYVDVKSKVDLFSRTMTKDEQFQQIVDWADVHTGELISDMTARSRKKVVNTIIQGYQDKITSRELQDRLFEDFSEMNRDWRRIAETETATNFNNGYIIGELEEQAPTEPLFMKGISGARACPFCRDNVNGRTVTVLEEPPDGGGDQIQVNGTLYTAIWPGKTNYGRSRANWWVASGSQHPHCRCTWTRYDAAMLGESEYEKKLREILAR